MNFYEGLPEALVIMFLLLSPLFLNLVLNFCLRNYFRNKNANQDNLSHESRYYLEKCLYDNNMNLKIRLTKGCLTDYYDCSTNVIHLSEATYYSSKPVAIAVAFHEFSHAVQAKNCYVWYEINVLFQRYLALSGIIAFLGFCLYLILGGKIIFLISLLSFLIYLVLAFASIKTEVNASNLAMNFIEKFEDIPQERKYECYKMLKLAYWTYIFNAIAAFFSVWVFIKSNK